METRARLWLNTRMDSYTPYQGPNGSSNTSPYDFILNPQKPSRAGKFGKKNNLIVTLAIIVVVVLVLMIGTTILLNTLAPKTLTKQDYIGVAQTQNELIRISVVARDSSVQQATQNLATTVDFTLLTQQQQTLQVLSKSGVKLGKKDLALKQDATTDQKFASAKATSTFDTTYTQIIQAKLNDYASTVKALYNKATSKKDRDLMSGFYSQTELLIGQIPYTQSTIDAAGQ